MINRKNCYFFILWFSFCASAVLFCEETQSIQFSADRIDMKTTAGDDTVELFGHAKIESDSFSITAEQIILAGKEASILKARRNVQINDTEEGLTGTSFWLEYHHESGKLKMSGQVEISNSKDKFIARSSFLEMEKKGAPVMLRAAVRIFQEDMFARADMAIYNKTGDQLQLIGNVYISKDGEIFKNDRTTVNLKTKEITLEGDISGNLQGDHLEFD